jgi:hypothetical protein
VSGTILSFARSSGIGQTSLGICQEEVATNSATRMDIHWAVPKSEIRERAAALVVRVDSVRRTPWLALPPHADNQSLAPIWHKTTVGRVEWAKLHR